MAARWRGGWGLRAIGLAAALVVGCSNGGGSPPTLDGPPGDRGPDRLEPDAIDRPVDSPPEVAPDAGTDALDGMPDATPDAYIYPDVMFARFVLTPESHDFQSVPVGMTPSRTFTLENQGQVESGTPSVTLSGTTDGNFQIVSNGCETSLDPQTSCTIEVQFAPSTAGRQSALLEVEAAPGGRVSAQLDGTGGS